MRTLSRPMFNMGGPIKQGIMHGIREPYRGGQLVRPGPGRPGYAGPKDKIATGILTKVLPKIGLKPGFIRKGWQNLKNVYKGKPNIYDPKKAGTYLPSTVVKTAPGMGTNRWWWEKAALPVGGAIKKTVGAVAPYATTGTLGYMGYQGGKRLFDDKTIDTTDLIEDNVIRKGDKDYGPHTKGDAIITQEMREAKAKADKEKRINDLLDTMGYDKARKNAAYDALIDAGRMVSERGTLDPKNIGRELIDPIIAATSARFDKPQQIREAVGLMKVKADIAKQLEDPQVAEQRRLNIEIAKKGLAGNTLSETIENYRVRQGTPTGATLAAIARGEGIEAKVLYEKVPKNTDALEFITQVVTKSHEDGKPFPPGDYVISDRIISIDETGNVTPLDI